ncbi:hypothetical protein [Wohlfahrtiimonas larvae]|uniref:Uncharacterized protein n=1 Tax=Wohlfahrtiimonas larvae TaxID=1157986 RepID=A0ABP9MNH7_9GAMM|nr:hypothetical protein [Wohlfahrtiimonas larvae]
MGKRIIQSLSLLNLLALPFANAGGGEPSYNNSIIFGHSEISSNLPYLTPYNDTRVNAILQLNDNVVEEQLLMAIKENDWYADNTPNPLSLPVHTSLFVRSNYDLTKERLPELVAVVKKLHQDYFQYWENNQEDLKQKGIWFVDPEIALKCEYYCSISDLNATLDYIDAVEKSSMSAAQKYTLSYARYQLFQEKEYFTMTQDNFDLSNDASRDFYRYLEVAMYFNNKEYKLAKEVSHSLLQSDNTWLKETSLYLQGRLSLKEAQDQLVDEWEGTISNNEEGKAWIDQSRAEFKTYMDQYPNGLYFNSAQGLLRRLNWLSGNNVAVVRELERWYQAPDQYLQKDHRYNERLLDLLLEVDRKVVDRYENQDVLVENPQLLAVRILQSLRYYTYAYGAKIDYSFEHLVGQYQSHFKDQPRLYQYLVATYYSEIDPQPKKVVELLPVLDESKQTLTTFELSEQILRAQAFEAQKRWSAAETIWQELYKRTNTPLQRELIEVGIADNYVLADRVDLAFTANSIVQNPALRDSLIEDYVSRGFVIDLIKDGYIGDDQTRAKWLYIQLTKDVKTINPTEFFEDIKLVDQFKNVDVKDVAHFDFFNQSIKNAYQYQCGTPMDVMQQLASNPNDSHNQMCYSFMVERMPAYTVLGDHQFTHLKPSNWAEQIVTNYDSYRKVIDNPKANKDDRALALYHGINCYNRGINRCDDKEIPKSERKRWFDTLKREHSDSQWAKQQKYYW